MCEHSLLGRVDSAGRIHMIQDAVAGARAGEDVDVPVDARTIDDLRKAAATPNFVPFGAAASPGR